MGSVQETFEKVKVFKNIRPSSLDEIASIASIKEIKKGDHLFHDKELVTSLYIIVDGMVSLYKMNSIGEKKVIFVYREGYMLNEVMLQDLPASINCEALENSRVLVLPREAFWRVMERDPALNRAVIESMALKIRRMYRQLKNTTNALNGEKRLAAKLLKLSWDYGIEEAQGVRIDMDLTITYLAEMLGSKRETVSRQVKKLTEMGLVIVKRNKFIIPDQHKLNNYFKMP